MQTGCLVASAARNCGIAGLQLALKLNGICKQEGRLSGGKRSVFAALMSIALLGLSVAATKAETAPRKPKLVIISLFAPEAAPWVKNLALDQKIPVAGLSADFPEVLCNADDVCLMTTGMGHANAAASTMALLFSDQLDLRKSYILIGGIAGMDPGMGTLGTAAWARYLVDFGLQQEIDAREKPAGWTTGYLGINAADPGAKPALEYKTEIFQLDELFCKRR
jgi:purine nucleoside permease